MKKVVGALLVLVCLMSAPARASGSFTGYDLPASSLTSYSVTVGPDGRVRYELAGPVNIGKWGGSFQGSCGYDPKTKRASESLTDSDGNKILTTSDCDHDPWETGSLCSGWTISVKGFNADSRNWIQGLDVPISAVSLSAADQANLARAKKKAEADAARARAVHNRILQPLPTPTPKNVHLAMGPGAHVPQFPTVAPTKVVLPTPTPAPLYGAVYTGGTPATMKVGQAVTVPITVQNTSSQAWPAGGAFHLAFHWYRGGALLVRDGDRTFITTAVAPGATVNLMAKVTAPPTAGASVLQWDMVQEGVTWFSDKGVPMSAPKNVNVTP